MKFLCDNCGTRYTIADEKVRRKVLKIRCRVCENVMTVRGPRTKPPSRMPPVISAPPNPLSPVSEPEWYAAPGNAQVGPMPFDRLTGLIEDGTVKRDTLVWNDGMDDWCPASEITALKIHFLPPPPPPPPPPPVQSLDEQDTRLFQAEKDSVRTVGGAVSAHGGLPAPPAPPAPPPAPRSFLDPPAAPAAPAPPAPPAPAAPAHRDTTVERPVDGGLHEELSNDFGFFGEGGPQTGDRATVAEAAVPNFDDFERAVPAATVSKPRERPRPQGPVVLVIVCLVIGVAGATWHLMSDKPIDVNAPDAALAAMTRRDAVVATPEHDAMPNTRDQGASVAHPDAAVPVARKTPRRRRDTRRKTNKGSTSAASTGADTSAATSTTPPEKSVEKKRFGGLAGLEKGKNSLRDALRKKRKEANNSAIDEAELPVALSQRRIVRVIGEHKRGFNSCYNRQIKRGESLKVGRLSLKFDIQPSGRTSNVNLGRKYEGTILKKCIKGLVKRLRFPRFSGEAVTIEYPLIFTSSL